MKRRKKRNLASILTKFIWKLFAYGCFGLVILFLLIRIGLFGKLPNPKVLENPQSALATEIYSSNNALLGKFYFREDRTNVRFKEIPKYMIDALVATEDTRFYKHSGIDPKSLARAIIFLGKRGGGSTITQQLAKNLFHNQPKSLLGRIIQKLKEQIISVELEKRYTKNEIILLYFNTVPWGNSYGIKSAAKTFFNKPVSMLKIEEAAMLVGMLKASGTYNPRNNSEKALQRRNTVFAQMKKYNYINDESFKKITKLPIVLDYNRNSHNQGSATYFREYLRNFLKPWAEKKGVNLYQDGLKIYTTIDEKMQKHAEFAVNKHMSNLQKQFYAETKRLNQKPWREEDNSWKVDKAYIPKQIKKTSRYKNLKKSGLSQAEIELKLKEKREMTVFSWEGEKQMQLSTYDSLEYYKQILHTGFMAMEANSGEIKAWVGGIDLSFFQYDHVAKNATRQVGSTFKPFVYARALEDEKIEPCEMVATGPVTFEMDDGQTWTPKNSSKVKAEMVSLYDGLKNSTNTVTARVLKRLGYKGPVAVKQLGIKMGLNEKKFINFPSICLGVMDLSVFEMVGAYATFVNKGIWTEPHFIKKIEDKNGNILEEFSPKRREAMREQTAYTMCKMLEKVTESGTGRRLHSKYDVPEEISIGGKTGTTQNNSDGWFMGITPDLVGGCWVGAEDRSVHFRNTLYGQGANMALPIYAYFINKVYKDKEIGFEPRPFKEPENALSFSLECVADSNQGKNNIDLRGLDF